MDKVTNRLDKTAMRRAFDHAAGSYDQVAVLQKEVGQRLLERVELIQSFTPERILDLGAGTGTFTKLLSKRKPRPKVIAADIAHSMMVSANRKNSFFKKFHCVTMDMDQPCFTAETFDFVFSNLALQWSTDLLHSFSQVYSLLKPGGLLLFSTFGPDTLKELRQAWQSVDQNIHVNTFVDMHDIGDTLLGIGYRDPVVDIDFFTLTYNSVQQLMQELKQTGAHNIHLERTRGLTGKNKYKNMLEAYEQHRHENVLPATYEVIYGLAWKPEASAFDSPRAIPVKVIS